MLLTSRKLLQRKLLDVESDLRGTLRNFGLKVGVVGGSRYEARVRELVEGFPGWPRSSSRCSVSAGSCASSSPSCTRCYSTWSVATRYAGG
jgi:hypothetical protein